MVFNQLGSNEALHNCEKPAIERFAGLFIGAQNYGGLAGYD